MFLNFKILLTVFQVEYFSVFNRYIFSRFRCVFRQSVNGWVLT